MTHNATMTDLMLSPLFAAEPLLPRIHGGGDEGGAGLLGVVESLLAGVTRLVEGDSSYNPIAGLLAMGSNVHPVLVHFPIAFLLGFLLLDLCGIWMRRPAWSAIASGMLYLGALAAVATAVAGLVAAESIPHDDQVHQLIEWHELLGLTVAATAAGLATWRLLAGANFSPMARALHLWIGGLMVLCMLLGADLGGLMVYQHGVGVHKLQDASVSTDHHHHHDHTD